MALFEVGKLNALKTHLQGRSLLEHSILNKGSAFTVEERKRFKLQGLIPAAIESLEQQSARTYEVYRQKGEDLSRHIFLRELQDRNETLFYRFLIDHIKELLPMIYTPVVGLACQRFSEVYRRSRGMFISYSEQDQMESMIANIDLPDVKVIVVSDGERILGLGDQGIGGMGIPIGKISLYTACGGLFPGFGLPIILDTGTDNEERLKDPFYFGARHRRIRGKEYDAFIDRFVQAILKRFPNVLLQWEDFAKDQARMLLDRYRDHCCTFNDDIQGTAAVALAGILAGVKANHSEMARQQIVIYGGGSAGTGIADEIALAMVRGGLSHEDACRRIWVINRSGLLHEGFSQLNAAQMPYAKSKQLVASMGMNPDLEILLEEVIAKVHPNVLIGVSGAAGAFTEKAVRMMAQFVDRPIIFPLSNPNSHCEARPSDLISWTNGKALIATGTQFPDVSYNGKTFKIGQCNNYYIFPAMGLGILASRAKRVSSGMFLAAAEGLAALSPVLKNPNDPLFPPPEDVRAIAKKLAVLIGRQAIQEQLAPPMSDDALLQAIDEVFWEPEYGIRELVQR